DGELGGVPSTLAELDDAGVTAATFLLGGSDLVEQDAHGVLPVKTGSRQTAVMQRAILAERDHFLSHRARGTGPRHGGGHVLVLDQAADQIRQHRVAVLAGAAQLGGSFQVTHTDSRNQMALASSFGASSSDASMFIPRVKL